MAQSDIYVAKQTFFIGNTKIVRGVTRVRAGHEILKGRESLFEPLDVHYDIERAIKEPGEKREPTPAPATPPEQPKKPKRSKK